MNRKMLERLTKEELIELVMRQEQAILSLDKQRYESNAIIEHLTMAAANMKDLRCSELKRDHDQEYLNDYVGEMYMKYPTYLVKTGTGEYLPQDEQPS